MGAKEDLGKRIKEAREKKGWTQKEVAKKASLSANYFAVIERGEVKTSFENIQKIEKALGVKLI